jgi:NAD(P)-dependent dehydrogenase (short-subunit alcohol dehydrogenase family)
LPWFSHVGSSSPSANPTCKKDANPERVDQFPGDFTHRLARQLFLTGNGKAKMRTMPESKIALVTGAGRGIGREIAQRLAIEGYACGLIARTRSQLEETVHLITQKGGRALVTPTDVSKREQVLAAIEAVEHELGPISVLINNAGAYLHKRFSEITEEEFDFQLKVNTYGPFFCTQAVVDRMAARGGGTVIFVLGSETRGGPAMYSAYNASKFAQRALAESVAYEYMHVGIHSATLDVDGAVDSARVREAMPNSELSHFVAPESICNEIVHLINQPRNAWSFTVDLRSFVQWRPRVAKKKV